MADLTVEAIAQRQAKQEGKFNQFSHRQRRVETEIDNTRSELTQAINRLFNKIDDVNNTLNTKMDAGFQNLRQEIQTAKKEFGSTRKWQISCVITTVIAVCAVIGLFIT